MILTLQRYLLRDLLKVFLLSLVGVTSVMVVLMVGQVLTRGGIPAVHVLKALPAFLPEVMSFTIPATLLFATTLVYGRFTRDNEFDAVRQSGVHPVVVVVPAVMLGTLFSCLVLYLTAEVIPRAHYRIKVLATNVDVLADVFFATLDEEGVIRDPQGRYTVKAGAVDGAVAKQVYIEQRNRKSHEVELTLQADQVAFIFDKEHAHVKMVARGAHVRTFGENGVVQVDKQEIGTPENPLVFPLPPPPPKRRSDLTVGELIDRLRETDDDDADTADLSDEDAAAVIEKRRERREERARQMATEIHLRLNLAASCLAMVLVGVPLSIRFRRGHLLGAFFMALGPMLVFHLMTFQAENLALSGSVPPAAPWSANLLLFLMAVPLYWHLFRH